MNTTLSHLPDYLLKRGYIDTRIRIIYEITAEKLTVLIGRVSQLQEIAEKICRLKIASFEKE